MARAALHPTAPPARNAGIAHQEAAMRPLFLALALAAPLPLAAQDFAGWPPLVPRFESTGGGGIMIENYDPVRFGGFCITNFAAVLPNGQRFENTVVFDAEPRADGVFCTNGRFRAVDGSGSGTTPLQVFIRADGARFRSP
jgi:hypothetical protein